MRRELRRGCDRQGRRGAGRRGLQGPHPPFGDLPGHGGDPELRALRELRDQLSTVHRYAGPLLDMATAARHGRVLPAYDRGSQAGRYEVGLLGRFDQIIVGRNRTRWTSSAACAPRWAGRLGGPFSGIGVMVLRNDPDLDVVNGQQVTVAQADPVDDGWLLQTTCGKAWLVDGRGFRGQDQQEAVKADRGSELVAATFAQAITCHAAQGSEWPSKDALRVVRARHLPSAEWPHRRRLSRRGASRG